MSESPRELALNWKKLFKEGTTLIDSGEYKQAISVLNKALSVMRRLEAEGSTQSGGVDDLRSAETLERIAFCHEKLGNVAEAEKTNLQVLKITESRLVGMLTTEGSVRGLLRIYSAQGRDDEIEALKKRYPYVSEEEVQFSGDGERHPEFSFMITLSSMLRGGGKTYALLEIAEELVAHTENCLGTNHTLSLELMRDLGKMYLDRDREKAEQIFTRALKIALAKDGDNLAEIAECMRALASCDPDTALSRAFTAKARSIEKELGIENLMDSTLSMILKLGGKRPPPDMVAEEVDRILANWRASQADDEVPFIAMEVTRKQRFTQLLSLARLVVAWDETNGVEEEFPLSRIGALGMVAECYRELGDFENARRFLNRELEITAKHWGDGHSLVTDVIAQLEEIDELERAGRAS